MAARLTSFLSASVFLLAGCATPPQLPVPLAANTFASPANKIGVSMSVMPKVDTHFPGAGCLLCLAAASMMHSALTTHTQTLPTADLSRLKEEVATMLRKKSTDVMIITEAIDGAKLTASKVQGTNVARNDFTFMKAKYGIDKLLLIDINYLGVSRNFASYIPTEEPKAIVSGSSALINLRDNTYEWFQPLSAIKSADSKWDEPPKFPGLTNAYFQAVEMTRDSVTQPLAK